MGADGASWWLRFEVDNPTRDEMTLRAVLSSPQIRQVDFYVGDGPRWRRSRAGSAVPLAARDSTTRHTRLPTLAFTVPPAGRTQVYLRISDPTPALLLQLTSHHAFIVSEAYATALVGALVGMMLLLTWSMVVISFFYRIWAFIALATVFAMQGLNYLCVYGYGRLYLWPNAVEWAYRSPTVVALLCLAVCTLALDVMLRLQKPVLPGSWLRAACAAIMLGLAAYAWLGDIRIATQIATAATISFFATVTVLMLALYRRAVPTAGPMLCAMLLLTGNFILQVAHSQGFGLAIFGRISHNMTPEPLYDMFGVAANVIVYAAWIRHISQQRAAAVQRLAYWRQEEEHRLRREVAARTIEVTEALAAVEEKSRQKTEMLAFIGHDLRAPLATIAGYVDRLSHDEQDARARGATRSTRSHAAPARASSIKAIQHSIDHQLSLIDELLEFSQGELQPLALRLENVHIGDLLTEVADHAAALCAQGGNRMVFHRESAIPTVLRADGKRLRQVLLNLLANAAKFTRHGTITMEVSVRMRGTYADCHFAVADTGDGIAPGAQQKIFHAFHQIERARGGVGLGLHIAERILREMHSGLHLQSTPNVGSRFCFDIAFLVVDATPHPDAPRTITRAAVPARRRSGATLTPPPAAARAELLSLALVGGLSDLEEWLDVAVVRYPDSEAFCAAIREALEHLDFERIIDLTKPDDDAP